MNKAFQDFTWIDSPNTTTPLSATNLNKLNDAIDTIDDRVIALDTNKSTVTVSSTGTATDEAKYITIDGVEKKISGDGTPLTWGNITGTLANQTDLASAIGAKSVVSVSASGTATDEVGYITVDGVEKKLPSGGGGGTQLYAHYLLIYEGAFGSSMYTTIISDSITPITADSLYTYLYNNGTALTIPITGKGKCNESGAERAFVASYITVGNTDTFSYYGLKGTVYTSDSKVYYDFVGYSNMSKALFEVTDKVVEL